MILYSREFSVMKPNGKQKFSAAGMLLLRKESEYPCFFPVPFTGEGIVNKQTESGVIPE